MPSQSPLKIKITTTYSSQRDPSAAPTGPQESWFKRWRGIILWCFCILFLLGFGYMAKRIYSYTQDIQNGTLDLSAFSEGGSSQLAGDQQVTTVDNQYVSNFFDDPSIGPADARITIVVFEDFECPFCGEEFSQIKAMLNAHANDVRLVYRDFPLEDLHPHAKKAAEAGQCAQEQQTFWPYHDKLFTHQEQLEVADLKQYAREVGLNGEQFDNCLDSGKYTEEVENDYQDGLNSGVHGTPTFFFNGNRVEGVISTQGFDQIIRYFEQ